ncbi:hypothetical protein SGPA1_50105 [Streptomyces misionensis JCM 4497]
MSERPKELASKASVAQVTEGSNPSATASERAPSHDGALSAFPAPAGRAPKTPCPAGRWSPTKA